MGMTIGGYLLITYKLASFEIKKIGVDPKSNHFNIEFYENNVNDYS